MFFFSSTSRFCFLRILYTNYTHNTYIIYKTHKQCHKKTRNKMITFPSLHQIFIRDKDIINK